MNIPDDSTIGCILEVDQEYPDELHNVQLLQFEQKPRLKSYIDLNTELRKKSTKNFEIFF